MYKDKNKKSILVNDKDHWFKNQINECLSYNYFDDYECHNHCGCYRCRPDEWDTIEDEISYYNSQEREWRFKKLFNEITTIGDFI